MNAKINLWIIVALLCVAGTIADLNTGVITAISGANVTDKSGNNHNLTLVGATLDTTRYLIDGGSIYFDGNDYAIINNSRNNGASPHYNIISGNNSFSVCGIYYLLSVTNFASFFSNVDTGSQGFVMSTGNNVGANTNLSASIYDQGGTRYDYFTNFPNASAWFSYCAVRDNITNTMNIYVNNTKTSFNILPASSVGTSSFNFLLGAWYTGGRWITGNVNQLIVWNRSLSDGEISEYWNNGNFKSYPFPASLYTTTLNLYNRYDNSTINYFQVMAYNSTHTHYANATTGSVSFTNLTGVYTLNITIPNYYESFKQIVVNISSSMSLINYSIQSLFNISINEIITNNSLSNFNASISNYSNSTTGANLLLITNNASQSITINKATYLTKTTTAQATSGQITQINEFLANNILRINATNRNNNATITAFNITIESLNYTYNLTQSTTTGNINFSLIAGTYKLYFISPIFELANVTITLNTTYQNYTFNVFYSNTIEIYTYDERLNTQITNTTISLSVYNNLSGTQNYTYGNGYILLTNQSYGFFDLFLSASGYASRHYYLTLADQSSRTLYTYLLNSSTTISAETTITTRDTSDNLIQGVTITIYKLFNNTYIPVEQTITDGTGKATLTMDKSIEYIITFEKSGFTTKSTTLKTIADATGQYRYTFVLSSTTPVTFITIQDLFSWSALPQNNNVAPGPINFSLFVTARSGTIEHFSITGLTQTQNITTQSAGGTASILLNLSSYTGQSIPITYSIKAVGYNLYSVTLPYYVNSPYENASSTFYNAMDEVKQSHSQEGLTLLALVFIVAILYIFSLIFDTFTPFNTSYYLGIVAGVLVGLFTFLGWINDLIGYSVCIVILLMYGFFTIRKEELRGG